MAEKKTTFSDKAKAVYNIVKEANEAGQPITAADIDAKTGFGMRSVTGVITGAFQNKGYMVRVEKTVKTADGGTETVKFIELTDEGKALDINA